MFIPNSPSPPSGIIHREVLLKCAFAPPFVETPWYHSARLAPAYQRKRRRKFAPKCAAKVACESSQDNPRLFESQRFNRIQLRGFLRRIVAEEKSHEERKRRGHDDRRWRNLHRPLQSSRQQMRSEHAHDHSEYASEQADDHRFDEELQLNVAFRDAHSHAHANISVNVWLDFSMASKNCVGVRMLKSSGSLGR